MLWLYNMIVRPILVYKAYFFGALKRLKSTLTIIFSEGLSLVNQEAIKSILILNSSGPHIWGERVTWSANPFHMDMIIYKYVDYRQKQSKPSLSLWVNSQKYVKPKYMVQNSVLRRFMKENFRVKELLYYEIIRLLSKTWIPDLSETLELSWTI